MKYRLGIDLGTNSLGWAVLELADDPSKPTRVIRLGSRIFSDGRNPKDGQSLAAMRRLPRSQRRRRDRYLKRRARLMDVLVEHGLMPAEVDEQYKLVSLDPYRLRALGLDQALHPHHFGRALFHLNQRRGFKSNRKADRSADKETGKVRPAIEALQARLLQAGARTVGEYLARLRYPDGLGAEKASKSPVRARLRNAGKKDAAYNLYVGREMVEQEFDALWDAQSRFALTTTKEDARSAIKSILFFQRPLRPIDPGPCAIDPPQSKDDREGRRAPLALPSAQRIRIYQELNHLRITLPGRDERPLTRDERDRLAEPLLRGRKLEFRTTVRTLLAVPTGTLINLEDAERRPALKGDFTALALGSEKCFGTAWHRLRLVEKDAIVERLLDTESQSELVDWLTSELSLPRTNALSIAEAALPENFSRLGRRAISRVLPELVADVVTFSEAVGRAGYGRHSQNHDGIVRSQLPYYGEVLAQYVSGGNLDLKELNEERRWGRLANPTVHIGLNQLRKLINALIHRYGKPEQIVVELARELKMSRDQKERLRKEQAENQRRNEQYRSELASWPGVRPNDSSEARLRWKLWNAIRGEGGLAVVCPYTGETISAAMLFSDAVEIDHILPFSRCLDDGIGNKVLCVRRANRDKAGQTPFEAFGHSPQGYDWGAIQARVAALFPRDKTKARRFAADGLDWYLREQDFLARQLVDTAYLSRVARQYLESLYPPDAARVWVTRGSLTGLIRGKWGLNRILSDSGVKDRTDHRHHAVDAAVIAVMERSLLKALSDAARRAELSGVNRLVDDMPVPYPAFRSEVESAVQRVVVSHKPDHGPQAALHNDTSYGLVDTAPVKGARVVVHRVPVATLQPRDVDENLLLPSPQLHKRLSTMIDGKAGKDLASALEQFSLETGIYRIRKRERLAIEPITDVTRRPYRGVKTDGNYCYEIWQADNGRWGGKIISLFRANRKDYADFMKDLGRYRKLSYSGQRLVMRLLVNDMVAIEGDSGRRVMRVVKQSEGKVVFAEHFEGGNLKERDATATDPFKYLTRSPASLQALKARRVFVDILGTVKDPGPPKCSSDASST